VLDLLCRLWEDTLMLHFNVVVLDRDLPTFKARAARHGATVEVLGNVRRGKRIIKDMFELRLTCTHDAYLRIVRSND